MECGGGMWSDWKVAWCECVEVADCEVKGRSGVGELVERCEVT